jgi:hypothetical protein
MFKISNTFTKIDAQSERLSKYQRFNLLVQYIEKSKLPPPFNLFSHIFKLSVLIICRFNLEKYNKVFGKQDLFKGMIFLISSK